MKYDHTKIEPKWQEKWNKARQHTPDINKVKSKFYNLWMFPYPSGEGLHAGHAFASTGSDAFGRYMRMNGKAVFQPIGYDSFGIHGENFAIKVGKHPKELMEKTTKYYESQLRSMGHGYDWSHTVTTSDTDYYKWTQWLFVQMFKAGLAYKKKASVNWCPGCKTVLADEQIMSPAQAAKVPKGYARIEDVPEGIKICERCGSIPVRKELEQWFFKITAYADRLLVGLEEIDWSERVVVAQKEWIGRSEGHLVRFGEIEVFTTRLDTINGATFLVLSPEVAQKYLDLVPKVNKNKVSKYIKESLNKSEQVRKTGEKKKTGVSMGFTVANPANGKEIPVWVADYVLGSVGTGAIMAVPKDDERDAQFAKKYKLPIAGSKTSKSEQEVLIKKGIVKKQTNYHLRDWLISRQRYWGPPIPMIYCTKCAVDSKSDLKVDTNFLYNESFEFTEELARRFYHEVLEGEHIEVPALKNERVYFTHEGWDHIYSTYRSKIEVISRFFALPKTIFALSQVDKLTDDKPRIYKKGGRTIKYWAVQAIVDGAWIRVIIRQLGRGQKHFYSVIWKGEEKNKSVKQAIKKGVVSRLYPRLQVIKTSNAYNKYITFIENLSRHKSEKGPGGDGWFPVPEEDLPVLLPEIKDYQPEGKGKGPLANHPEFYQVKCPNCGADAQRETDVSDTFVDSSWYFLRYPSTRSTRSGQVPFDSKITKKWLPVDLYFGGAEHAVLHLMYSRFVTMALHDLGYLDFEEPFPKFFAHGLVIKDGAKMSKSRGNVVNPDEYIKKYGADTLRLYLMFMGPMDGFPDFRDTGIEGMYRFLQRVWNFVAENKDVVLESEADSREVLVKVHQTIKKVTSDIESFKYNTAIASIMEFVNVLNEKSQRSSRAKSRDNKRKIRCAEWDEAMQVLAQLLAPFAPHITEELWVEVLGQKFSIHVSKWPKSDPEVAKEEEIVIAVQVNGKLRSQLSIKYQVASIKEEVIKIAKQDTKVRKWLTGKKIKKTIYVPGKIVNFVV
ncbi:hypothetical protein A3F62_03050 [Candidatus Woesebacteria bacterium RIFCSPHIGHO2_12_FULL_44_11]|uniref:Leucine--tRNA ligase n=1 Tax=Candidatus Woesebacteria bacterium RIFCSPLOWO2_01_FULL_44_14 TaxID=1802525 RepID=A0A1F8C2N2_9BACT|nr:MAG: hypothetical protein A3F62_03050 [Candidatus Woesebacteria bacterium RIFCSPHIGHO2_12_FULL_44_11]OGM70596.1 MAG: hypothetical protein A2975_00075 [Candidatus Woesebacteria bacterium RIFCSPLOWO2_01_FULL_44_14]